MRQLNSYLGSSMKGLIMAVLYLHSYSAHAGENLSASENLQLDKIAQEINSEHLTKASLLELTRMVQQKPQNYRAHILLGNCCDSMGLPEQAIEQYKLAFKYGPNEPQAFVQLIKALLKSGQIVAAGNLLKEAQKRFPTNPEVLLWTGNELYGQHRYQEAEELYRQALSERRPTLGLYTALAKLRLREGKDLPALKLAFMDLAINPNYPPANEIAGLALMDTGHFGRALPHLAIAFQDEPSNYVVAFDYAQALIWSGKYDQSLLPLLCSLTRANTYQNKASVRNTIARVLPYLSKKGIQNCMASTSAFKFIESSADVHLVLADICIYKKLPDLAEQEYRQAVHIEPQNDEAKYKLALFLENYRHDYASALKYLREAQSLSPFNYQISQHLMRLQDRLTLASSDWAWQLKDWLNFGKE